jgi:endonuclease/exonuclease/phosphatase (EEP) superfamily protein YafD
VYSIDAQGNLQVLVWNLHKQNAREWRNELIRYSEDAQIVLLQEVRLTTVFKRYIKDFHWHANHVDAFTIFNNSAGVLSAGRTPVEDIYCYLAPEPVFRLPKSSSISRYKLSNGQILTAVNVHLINFTLGLKAYRQQMQTLIDDLKYVEGPMIFAGDFNTWSRERQRMIDGMMEDLGLEEAHYANDTRRRFLAKLALDHVYYRGLDLQQAEVLQTTASDHNPILVEFKTTVTA